MDPAIADRLVELNRTFYDDFAGEFSASRRRLHDGIVEVFRRFDGVRSLLDVGCGDGRVGRAWVAGQLGVPWQVGRSAYLGVDNAAALLQSREAVDGLGFAEFDLAASDLGALGRRFDHVVSFSVLHHIPGVDRRHRVVRSIGECLDPGGGWAVSVWQIRDKPRFADRIRPWSEVGLRAADLDEGDLLVDWRQGGAGHRYVHHFEEDELVDLFESNGLPVSSVWRSDGRSGDLGLYLTGRRAAD